MKIVSLRQHKNSAFMLFVLFVLLLHIVFSNGLMEEKQQQKEDIMNNDTFDAKETPSFVKFAQTPTDTHVSSHQLLFDRLSDAKRRFVHRQMAKIMAMEEGGGGREAEERRIPRPQRRWLMRTKELMKDSAGGDQYVKRMVSESELNALLKNAWLGKKR